MCSYMEFLDRDIKKLDTTLNEFETSSDMLLEYMKSYRHRTEMDEGFYM